MWILPSLLQSIFHMHKCVTFNSEYWIHHQNLSGSSHQNIPPESSLIFTTWLCNLCHLYAMTPRVVVLMALICSVPQILTFKRFTQDFEKDNSFCRVTVFCYLSELFWQMHSLLSKFQLWAEKLTKVPEKNCKLKVQQGSKEAARPHLQQISSST